MGMGELYKVMWSNDVKISLIRVWGQLREPVLNFV